MHASSLFVLAAAGAASVLAAQTTTSTATMTAYVTLTQCDAAHPDCPLHTPTTSSSVAVSTSSSAAVSTSSASSAPAYSVQAHPNTTVASYPTAQYNATTPKYTISGTAPVTIQTSVTHDAPTKGSSYPTAAPSPSPIPETSAAGAVSLASGLLVGALGAVAAMLV